MKAFLFVVVISCLSITDGQQQCQAKFNQAITGECDDIDSCQGTLVAFDSCEWGRCCVTQSVQPSPNTCITNSDFDYLYNTSRATYLRSVLNVGINLAGICNNCQAKAAFLAVAAAMTEDFQKDEATGTDAQFAGDDNKYENTQAGDGSRYRRRGLFGLRGREMYSRLQRIRPQYQSLTDPEQAALIQNAIDIASVLWNNPDLQSGSSLTQYADGSFYSFSILWFKLTGGIEGLSDGAKQYSKFLRQLQCGGDLYPGQGQVCQYNTTHTGLCSPDCIKGLEDAGEFCGCSGEVGPQCPNSPVHIRCCLGTCSQELKMDLGFVLDASGSIGLNDYLEQIKFTKDLLRRVNVGKNKTHVGIINYSSKTETLTWLNTDYDLEQKIQRVGTATYFGQTTNTALALQQAATVFSYGRGLRQPEEGVLPVIFVITDGASDNKAATIQAATVLKKKGINLVSVGVGTGPKLDELQAICTPPASENYFAMSNYAALEQKINQFTSKTCSEPVTISSNTTVTTTISKDKYKFLKIEIVAVGNKILITVKLFNGKVKLFYSFTSRNPKDPQDFHDYTPRTDALHRLIGWRFLPYVQTIPQNTKANSDEVTLVIDKPDEDVDFVYIGVKGVEDDNSFEVKLDDCANVDCRSKASDSTMKMSVVLLVVCAALLFI